MGAAVWTFTSLTSHFPPPIPRYGYVSPADVTTLLEQHIQGGEIVEKLWRGRMGLTEDQQKAELKRVAASREAEPSGTADGTCEGCDCGKAEGKVRSR